MLSHNFLQVLEIERHLDELCVVLDSAHDKDSPNFKTDYVQPKVRRLIGR